MTPEVLAAVIISFCDVKSQDEVFKHPVKKACVMFLLNCAVGKNGVITSKGFGSCTTKYRENKQAILAEYGG